MNDDGRKPGDLDKETRQWLREHSDEELKLFIVEHISDRIMDVVREHRDLFKP